MNFLNFHVLPSKNEGKEIFCHHIYEYQKGIRNLILHTAPVFQKNWLIKKLEISNIDYYINAVNKENINIFFGHAWCVEIIKSFGKKPLNLYTDEEDFILGILLGYDKIQQCGRFLNRKKNSKKVDILIG